MMAVGAAILLIFAIRAFARSLQPLHVVLRSLAAMSLAVFFALAALALVVLSLFS
ncbi:hypothetical protein ACIA5D_46985 [Actinoplanes sp. NPDC051513]|uniref:hypothetical protein n=1 Tax=Actinoplanes sp. NPDC051513 TaxID=3363908 RepID=UPI00379C061A